MLAKMRQENSRNFIDMVEGLNNSFANKIQCLKRIYIGYKTYIEPATSIIDKDHN